MKEKKAYEKKEMHHYHLASFNNCHVFTQLVESSHTADSEHLQYDFTLYPVWKEEEEEEIKQTWRNLSNATFTCLIIGKILKDGSSKTFWLRVVSTRFI